MVLEKYKQKRNFTNTPEPSGDVKLAAERAKAPGPRRNVSSACRSTWPATCTTTSASSTTACCSRGRFPRDRRSIRRPSGWRCTSRIIRIEYGTFEGVIPEGYGAGIVMLWDVGTWTPQVDDVDARAEEGRPEVHARRLQAEGLVGAGAHRRLAGRAAADAAGCSSSIATTGPATSTSPSSRRAASRATATSRTFSRPTTGCLGLEPPGQGRRSRRDAREDHRTGRGVEEDGWRRPERATAHRETSDRAEKSGSEAKDRGRKSVAPRNKPVAPRKKTRGASRQDQERMKRADFILFSGGAPGAEAEFGACAERHRHRGSELHLRRPHHRPAPRRARPQSRGAAGGRRQPRVRLAADAPPLHRQPDDPQGSADALVSGQQRPGNLRRRRHPRRRDGARRARAGAPSSRSCATSRCSCSIRRRTAGSSGQATSGVR